MKKGGKMPSIEIEGESEKEFVLREGIIMPLEEARALDRAEGRTEAPELDRFEAERRAEREEDEAIRRWRGETTSARR